MPETPRPDPVTLDGRSFHGIVLQAGKTGGDAGTLQFFDGRFRSTACDQYDDGDGIHFTAETDSPRWGRLPGRGTVTGARLDGTPTMVRDGTRVGEKWVLAGEG